MFILSAKEKDIIDAAKNICKGRVQFPKDQRSQNAYEFIEQKKEMFLVQLSHNTIKKEIELLNTKVERKQKALEQSSMQLNDDERIVRGYVENDNDQTKKLELHAESQQQERKKREDELKDIDSQIQNLRSEYQKHQDTLDNLQDHKAFLLKLSDVDFINKKVMNQKQREQELKTRWIKEHMNNDWEDHIIFAEEIEAQQNTTIGKPI